MSAERSRHLRIPNAFATSKSDVSDDKRVYVSGELVEDGWSGFGRITERDVRVRDLSNPVGLVRQ
jgi:hypothetical protein